MLRYLLIFCLLPSVCFAGITFTDGKWETTFDCTEQSQADGILSCDDMVWGGNWTFIDYKLSDGSTNLWTQSRIAGEWYYIGPNVISTRAVKTVLVNSTLFVKGTLGSLTTGQYGWGDNDSLGSNTIYVKQASDPDGQADDWIHSIQDHGSYVAGDYATQITSSANNIAGSGRGGRFWFGDGATANTGPFAIQFPTAQTELWIRFYSRYPSGHSWGPIDTFQMQKMLIAYTAGTNLFAYFEFYEENQITIVAQATSNYYKVKSISGGWQDTMGGDVGDGEWHYYEIHLKMDTNQTDGIGEIWVDGDLKISVTDMDWSNGDANAKLGWTYIKLPENARYVLNHYVSYVDIDDIVIYNTTPPGRDDDDNPFIGPIAEPTTGSTASGTGNRR